MGLESAGGRGVVGVGVDVDEDLELVLARIAKERSGVPDGAEKGLVALVAADSEGRRVRRERSEEGPAVGVSANVPTAAHCAGGGLLRRNSTTLPGSPSASRWK